MHLTPPPAKTNASLYAMSPTLRNIMACVNGGKSHPLG